MEKRIEMVEIANGCPESCKHCGAYPKIKSRRDLEIRNWTRWRLKQRISMHVGNFNNFVTTHVNSEPLWTDTFADYSLLVDQLSNGDSKVIAISHGVRIGVEKMVERLNELVELMQQDTIPLFVLSVDNMRSEQNISQEINRLSYRLSIQILQKALDSARISFSIQGETREQIESNRRMIDGILEDLNLVDAFNIFQRGYTAAGRMLDLEDSEDCDVIPDPWFVENVLYTGHEVRQMIDFKGCLLEQPNRPGKTYGDSVNKQLWKPTT